MVRLILLFIILLSILVWYSLLMKQSPFQTISANSLRLKSNGNQVSYVITMKDLISNRYITHVPCKNSRNIDMSSYIEDALFLMTINTNGQTSFKVFLPSSKIPDPSYLSSVSVVECPNIPSIHSTKSFWSLRDVYDPISEKYEIQWKSSENGGYVDCKIYTDPQGFLMIDNDKVDMSTRIDDATTIKLFLFNQNISSNSILYSGVLKINDKYINHVSTVPKLSTQPTSAIYLIHFSNSCFDNGFHESNITIQAHPESNTKYFPSWFLNWDLNSGCILQSANPIEWKFNISHVDVQDYGVSIFGYLQHIGYYLENINGIFKSSLSKPANECCIVLFNHFIC